MKRYRLEYNYIGGDEYDLPDMVEDKKGEYVNIEELKQFIAENLPNYVKIVEELMRL